tara:strand:+ start:28 stop:330 length:303 start_codon:yes stop_codon:yes gene_type:complete
MKTSVDYNQKRALTVKFLAPTNYRGARISITEKKRYSQHKTNKITLSYDYEIGNVLDQALNFLDEKYEGAVSGYSGLKDEYIILMDWYANGINKLTDLSK